MRNHQPLRRATLAAALIVPLCGPGPAHAAGLFEALGELFGGAPEQPRYQPVPRRYHGGEGGLDITVRPRRHQPRRERPVARREKPAAAPVNLDPVTNPDWYLDDPTLRPGDIVVLKGEVLVLQGGRAPFSREDFTSLDKSRLSKDERERIGAMARLPVARPATEEPARKTATAISE